MQRLAHEHEEAERRRAAAAAARTRRIASAGVALTEADLDSMKQPGSPFRTVPEPGARPYGLAECCAHMIERVKAVFPSDKVTPAPGSQIAAEQIKWHGGSDTKTHVQRGGGEAALGKLKVLLADQNRPWYHGAKLALLDRQK